MTGQRRMDRNLRRFQITDFSDHDHVRILTKNGAQSAGKRQLDLRVDLHLADALKLIFDRILYRNDIFVRRIDLTKCRIERGGFSAPSWPRGQNDAMAKLDELSHDGKPAWGNPDIRQVQEAIVLFEQAQHHPLSMRSRQHRDSEIHVLPRGANAEPSVLR